MDKVKSGADSHTMVGVSGLVDKDGRMRIGDPRGSGGINPGVPLVSAPPQPPLEVASTTVGVAAAPPTAPAPVAAKNLQAATKPKVIAQIEIGDSLAIDLPCESFSWEAGSSWLVLSFDSPPIVKFMDLRALPQAFVKIGKNIFLLDHNTPPNKIMHGGTAFLFLPIRQVQDELPATETLGESSPGTGAAVFNYQHDLAEKLGFPNTQNVGQSDTPPDSLDAILTRYAAGPGIST